MVKCKIFSNFDPDMSMEIYCRSTSTMVKCKIFSNFDADMSMEISLDLPVLW